MESESLIKSPSALVKQPSASLSKWKTPEFFVYYLVIALATIFTVKEVITISSSTHPGYPKYSHLLSNGFFGLKIDLSDHQFRTFRNGIPSLAALLIVFVGVNRRFGNLGRFIGTVAFIALLHGFKACEPLLLISLNYFILKTQLKPNLMVPFTWFYAISCLFLLGFHLPNWTFWGGFLPNWNIVFKISILRLISFNLDYHKTRTCKGIVLCCPEVSDSCHKCLTNRHSTDFSFQSYFMYIFYPPLYLSGPIMTFNHFIHQTSSSVNPKKPHKFPWIYGLRLLTSMLTLEIILHFFHVCAIKSASAWHSSFTPLAFSGIAFFNLKIIWLKLLIIWRFARFFALCDGIDPPENMIRCMSNNYSTLRFWRAWHRSFNLWILRYLYIPLGGRATSNLNIFPIFAFVALWHDVNWQLMAWGCLIPLIILPEVLANWIAKRFKMNQWKGYRAIAAFAASLNIFLLMLGNLVGFSVGIEGARIMLNQIIHNGGFIYILSLLVVFFSAAQIMFEIREEEFRRTGKPSST